MESRLRKLLSPRKHKAPSIDATAELDLQSIPSSTTPSQGRLPVLIGQALRKTRAVKLRESSLPTDPLSSFSYEEAAPGKPPQLGDRPQRGNGPVKLQTSRRLSSGELLVTEQDYDRTLEEIREGEYIVGGRDRRVSKSSSQPKSPTEPTSLKFISTAPSSPREDVVFSAPIWQPPSVPSEFGPVASPALNSSIFHPPQRSFSAQACYPDYRHDGFGLSSPAQPLYARPLTSSTSLLETQEEHNPTIHALWKAEYSRLVSMCGQTGVDQPMVERGIDHGAAPSTHSSSVNRHRSCSHSSRSLSQPFHLTNSLARTGACLRTNASTSVLDLAYHDDRSEGSSHLRYSHLSSSGASSSLTTRTSMAEESSTTRDDIRKIVDEMRTTYLQAIEAQTPPLHPVSSPSLDRPRSKTQTPSLMSYASVDSSLRSASRQSTSTTRTKSWQSNSTHFTTPRPSTTSPMKSKRPGSATSRRTSGQPGAGIATLTPIEASPAKSAKLSQNKKPHDGGGGGGLKRADSTTLGAMARKLAIVDDRLSTVSSQPGSKRPPTFYNSSGSDSDSSLSAASSPTKDSSVQHTPVKHKSSARQQSPLAKHPWQIDVDQILPRDEDLELALDLDDFETLCDGLFNAPASTGNGRPGIFEAWNDRDAAAAPPQRHNTDTDTDTNIDPFDHDAFASTGPAELKMSKFANHQLGLGLGLTGLPAMI
ncbi:hypothetical protein G647_09587 [Cladophialophora carrionii CBS 160.54]|uniref:Uncharacterized protein n=1 Tax=Cladophialophora carrionii CBS 160.54 TaxID=1279043 RepID=V9DN76_9EURO|nr:uncharacterized protein G647_09587 [Cladophialophora carrionii CBS 160.54]ETI27397.1 hypothetical protein G647_09587 [Cladophialophora carrionii CBS 160.54]